MNCEEVKIGLHDYIDNSCDDFLKREIDHHLHSCDKCFNNYKKLKIFSDKLRDLSDHTEVPKDIIEALSSKLMEKSLQDRALEETKTNLQKSKEPKIKSIEKIKDSSPDLKRSFISRSVIFTSISNRLSAPVKINWFKIILTLMPLILIVVGYLYFDYKKNNSPWAVSGIEGSIDLNGKPIKTGFISEGESLFTKEHSKTIVEIPLVGKMGVSANSIIVLEKAKDGNNRIFLRTGSITITNSVDMPSLSIKTNKCTILDRSGEFSVTVNDSGKVLISVKNGFVEYSYFDKNYFINEGYACELKDTPRPGIPFKVNAPDTLKNEIRKFNFDYGGEPSIDIIMSLAKPEDMLTLLDIIPQTTQVKRQALFQVIANHFPPPPSITRMDIVNGDNMALYLWWQEIQWQL